MIRQWHTRLGLALVATVMLGTAACGTEGPGIKDLKDNQRTAIQENSDPVVKALIGIGYEPARISDPGDRAPKWFVLFECRTPPIGDTCNGTPEVQVPLKGEPKDNQFAFDSSQNVVMANSGYACTVSHEAFEANLVWSVAEAVRSQLRLGQSGLVTVDGVQLDCTNTIMSASPFSS